jgi:hypothetical protein
MMAPAVQQNWVYFQTSVYPLPETTGLATLTSSGGWVPMMSGVLV